jgi:chemotaxis protein MotB
MSPAADAPTGPAVPAAASTSAAQPTAAPAAAPAVAPTVAPTAGPTAAPERRLPEAPKPAQQRTPSNTDAEPSPRSSLAAWIVAAAAVLVSVGALAAYLSARSDVGTERKALANTLVTVGTLRADNAALQQRIDGLEADRKQLAEEARVKAEALAAMQSTQDELQQRLQAEVTKGSVLISQQQGELVVDLIDQVVFDSGKAELNEKGKAVLWQVGETLARVPDKVIQVSGHTDSLPISGKLKEEFPTNWELSTARATQVVRYLQEVVKVPANRLVAAGLAETRPIARNTTWSGRSKNRRIEVRLLPMPKK